MNKRFILHFDLDKGSEWIIDTKTHKELDFHINPFGIVNLMNKLAEENDLLKKRLDDKEELLSKQLVVNDNLMNKLKELEE